MLKMPRVRTVIDCQHVKGSETLLISAWQYIFDIFGSIWEKITSKTYVLVVSEILRLFVNILTPDEKYSLSVKEKDSCNQFKCNYLQRKKHFLNSFPHFRKLHKIWNPLKKKDKPQRLFVSEIINCKKRAHLNA